MKRRRNAWVALWAVAVVMGCLFYAWPYHKAKAGRVVIERDAGDTTNISQQVKSEYDPYFIRVNRTEIPVLTSAPAQR